MDLSLSNSLVGGGSMNPDGLSLDLQFAADKTLTARRGPTPVFSRGSSGTFVNADGLIVGKTTANRLITPSIQAIGSQVNVSIPSGVCVGWVVGQPISLIVDTDGQDDPDVNELWLLGNIVSIVGNGLTFTVTARTGQSGTATDWTLGYRGPRFDHDPVGKTNLLTRSQEFNLSPWGTNNAMTVTPDATIAPDGTLTADAINFDTNSTSRIIYLAGSAVVHTFSVWLRADTNRTCIIATAANASANIDVVANVTTTWQRFSVVASNWSSSTSSFNVRIANNASGTIFAWGAQLEAGSTATNYIPTTTAPVTIRDCKGLLIEGERENKWSASEDLGAASFWQLINTTTLNSNNTTAPDGLTTADRLTVGSTTQEYGVFRNTFSFVSGTTYTISCYLKADQVTRVSIYAVTQATLPIDAYFDLTGNGSVTANASGTASIQKLSNGWYRCVITGTASASAITSVRINAATTGNSRNYDGNSVDSFWAWGTQLEAGAFPTSYIPTTTASAARAADLCTITGGAFSGLYNNGSGTLLSEAMIANLIGDNRGIVQIDNGANTSIIRHVYALSDGGFRSIIRASADSQTALSSVAGTASTIQKRVIAYEGTAFASTTNGGTVATATRAMPAGLNAMRIGNLTEGNYQLNGHIAAIRFYKKRLPNAKLQALTV
jgi:hypothetical protein